MPLQPAIPIIVQPEVTDRTIKNACDQWRDQRQRYDVLFSYYVGAHPFSKEDGAHIVANYCNYIPKMIRGYMFANPPRYVNPEGDPKADEITDLYTAQDMWLIDTQLGKDMSIYGKAFELVYLPEGKTEPRSVVISPRDAFVAYAGDMERDSVFGAVRYSWKDDSKKTHYRLYIYDQVSVSIWESESEEGPWKLTQPPVPHGFGRVPLIEYRNNGEMQGDFEGILSLQDAYNALLSDRQDDKDAFAEAMLMIKGAVLGVTDDEIEAGLERLKRRKVIHVDEDSDIGYLTKTMDEGGIAILQSEYNALIHKMSFIPDLSDEQFAGNASGVAMAYKLFGTDQIVAEKEAQFRKGYRRRCKLYDHILHNPTNSDGYSTGDGADIDGMTIEFTLNVPQDLSYIASALPQLTASGIISKATARKSVYLVEDPDEEEAQVAREQAEDAKITRDSFAYDEVDAMRSEDEEA